jgi:hypothetical protein
MPKDKENSNMLDIIKGVQQAVANAYDGARDEDGEFLKIGLKRDVENPITDSRVMDGFGVVFETNRLKITYHGEIQLKDVYESKMEKEMENMFADIVSFLKKEYKKVTGNTLTLTPDKKPPIKMLIQSTSRIRAWIQASKVYTIGGVDIKQEDGEYQKGYKERWEKWVELQNEKPKRPKNEKITKKDNEKPEEYKKEKGKNK